MIQSKYRRVLLKITGEALKGDNVSGYDAEAIHQLAKGLAAVRERTGVQLALVIGGGNLWRGGIQSSGGKMERVTADYMGMLATVMNALALCDAFRQMGVPARVQTSVNMMPIAEPFNHHSAMAALNAGEIVIFGGGTGSPFFTTDTTATLRALETDCEAVLKATKVNGIYTADPKKDPTATRFTEITFEEVLSRQLAVMDLTAFSMCRERRLPIIVFDFSDPSNLEKVLLGDVSIATVVK